MPLGQWEKSLVQKGKQKLILLLAELPGEQQLAVYCAPFLLVHGGVGKEQLEEGWEGGEHLDDQGGQ